MVGAGSAGCTVTAGLIEAKLGTVCTLEAGCSDNSPLAKTPFALMFMMGSRKRDWRYATTTTPQTGLGGRVLVIPSGKNDRWFGPYQFDGLVPRSMDDFDNWGVDGWSSSEVIPAFEQVESRMLPQRLPYPRPLAERLARTLHSDGQTPPSPEHEGAGVFHVNIRDGQRWSPADAFLQSAKASGKLTSASKRGHLPQTL